MLRNEDKGIDRVAVTTLGECGCSLGALRAHTPPDCVCEYIGSKIGKVPAPFCGGNRSCCAAVRRKAGAEIRCRIISLWLMAKSNAWLSCAIFSTNFIVLPESKHSLVLDVCCASCFPPCSRSGKNYSWNHPRVSEWVDSPDSPLARSSGFQFAKREFFTRPSCRAYSPAAKFYLPTLE